MKTQDWFGLSVTVHNFAAFELITQLRNVENTPDLAFVTSKARRRLLRKILVEVKNKSWKQEDERKVLISEIVHLDKLG